MNTRFPLAFLPKFLTKSSEFQGKKLVKRLLIRYKISTGCPYATPKPYQKCRKSPPFCPLFSLFFPNSIRP